MCNFNFDIVIFIDMLRCVFKVMYKHLGRVIISNAMYLERESDVQVDDIGIFPHMGLILPPNNGHSLV